MTDTRQTLPPLPKKRRAMLCTKCGFSGPTEAEASPHGAKCQRCDYTAFVEEQDYNDDEMQAYARAALSAQPVAGAVATDESGWLIEHSGEILPGAEQRAQVSWLRVQMKFNGYGAREFGFTHDANEALRFARKEDAEAVLAMHLGASPPDWYSKPFSVTEHMWPLVPQAQAAPEPEPSAQYKEVGFFIRYSGRYPTGDFVGEIQAKYGLNEGDKLYKVIK